MSQEKGEILARAGCKIGLFVVEFFLCRLSSVVEHVHGKDGVSGSSPEDGSI